MTELIKSPDLNLRKTTLIETTKSGVNYRINFNDYLKHHNLSEISQEQLKNNINNKKNMNIEYYPQHHQLHIANYCKLRQHISKLEFHNFDHNWFTNQNKLDDSNFFDLEELRLVPGKLDYYLKHMKEFNQPLRYYHEKHVKFQID